MGKSIIVKDMTQCCVCFRPYPEVHHVIPGTANRDLSDQYRLVIPLCRYHHNEIHSNYEMGLYYKRKAQEAFEKEYPNLNFVQIFGRNFKED